MKKQMTQIRTEENTATLYADGYRYLFNEQRKPNEYIAYKTRPKQMGSWGTGTYRLLPNGLTGKCLDFSYDSSG